MTRAEAIEIVTEITEGGMTTRQIEDIVDYLAALGVLVLDKPTVSKRRAK